MHSGRSLREMSSQELLSVATYLVLGPNIRTEEEAEARDKVLRQIRDHDREMETGIPSVVMSGMFKSADGS